VDADDLVGAVVGKDGETLAAVVRGTGAVIIGTTQVNCTTRETSLVIYNTKSTVKSLSWVLLMALRCATLAMDREVTQLGTMLLNTMVEGAGVYLDISVGVAVVVGTVVIVVDTVAIVPSRMHKKAEVHKRTALVMKMYKQWLIPAQLNMRKVKQTITTRVVEVSVVEVEVDEREVEVDEREVKAVGTVAET
jgi:hypothetical protein